MSKKNYVELVMENEMELIEVNGFSNMISNFHWVESVAIPTAMEVSASVCVSERESDQSVLKVTEQTKWKRMNQLKASIVTVIFKTYL